MAVGATLGIGITLGLVASVLTFGRWVLRDESLYLQLVESVLTRPPIRRLIRVVIGRRVHRLTGSGRLGAGATMVADRFCASVVGQRSWMWSQRQLHSRRRALSQRIRYGVLMAPAMVALAAIGGILTVVTGDRAKRSSALRRR